MADPEKLGIMSQVFCGVFDNGLIFPYPQLSSDETETVEMLVDSFKGFARRKIDPVKLDLDHETPREILDDLVVFF